MTLGSEASLLDRALSTQEVAGAVEAAVLDRIGLGAMLDDPVVMNRVPNRFSNSCLGSCSLAPHRESCAVQSDD